VFEQRAKNITQAEWKKHATIVVVRHDYVRMLQADAGDLYYRQEI